MRGTKEIVLKFAQRLFVGIGVLLLTANICAAREITSFEELEHGRVGCWAGSAAENAVLARFPQAEIVYLTMISDMVQSLRQDKIDAFVVNRAYYDCMKAEGIDDVTMLEEPIGQANISAIFAKNAKGNALCQKMNDYVAKIRSDGTLQKLRDKWFRTGDYQKAPVKLTGENGTLIVASNVVNMPYIFMRNDEVTGFEIEIFEGFCAEYGYNYDVVVTAFESALVGVETGRFDAAVNCIEDIAPRRDHYAFSDYTYSDDCVVVVLKPAEEEANFFVAATDKFNKTFFEEERWKLLRDGMITTLTIMFASAILGTIMGFALCLLWREGFLIINNTLDVLWRFLNGLPVMVLLMFFYYVVFGGFNPGGTAVAVVVFTLMTGFSVFSMLKSGSQSIAKGQMEGALALGFSERQAFWRFILPQAIRIFLPSYREELVNLLKNTAIVGYIAVQDLTKMADLIRARTYDAFMPLFAIAALYFILSWTINRISERIEKKFQPQTRTHEEILPGVRL